MRIETGRYFLLSIPKASRTAPRVVLLVQLFPNDTVDEAILCVIRLESIPACGAVPLVSKITHLNQQILRRGHTNPLPMIVDTRDPHNFDPGCYLAPDAPSQGIVPATVREREPRDVDIITTPESKSRCHSDGS